MRAVRWVVCTARGSMTAEHQSYTDALRIAENWKLAGLRPELIPAEPWVYRKLKIMRDDAIRRRQAAQDCASAHPSH